MGFSLPEEQQGELRTNLLQYTTGEKDDSCAGHSGGASQQEECAMLMGEYRLSVESAGWLRLPCAIRYALRQLYAPDDTALIVTSFFDNCLLLYPRAEWSKMPERLARMGATPLDMQDFLTSAAVCLLDPEGRLYIPLLFREYAQITQEALLVGMICRLELWAPHRWEGYEAAN
jgi:MraZ protein